MKHKEVYFQHTKCVLYNFISLSAKCNDGLSFEVLYISFLYLSKCVSMHFASNISTNQNISGKNLNSVFTQNLKYCIFCC